MLCAFSSPICSHAFSPMSPALPGGPSPSLTLFIQTEQLGPSQPKQRWVGGRGEKLSWKLQVKPSVWNVSMFTLFSVSSLLLRHLSHLPWVRRVAGSGQPKHWTKHLSLIWILCGFPFFLDFFFSLQLSLSSLFEHTSSPQLQLKSWPFYNLTRKLHFLSSRNSTHLVLLLRWTKLTCCGKTELFVLRSFYSALLLLWWLSYCELQPVTAVPASHSPLSFTHFSRQALLLVTDELRNISGGKENSLQFIDGAVTLRPSWMPHHRRAELMRVEYILT